MTEHAADRVWSGIDIPKTLAGALAAVCAAVIGSFLGVAGTLIGAAVASIIGSVGTEIYHRSIRRGTQRLQETLAPAFVKAPAAVGTPEVAAATDEDSPSHTVPEEERPVGKKLRWGRIAAAAGILFVVAMGSLTLVELMAGKSVASMVGGSSSGTTTFSSVTDGGKKDLPAPVIQPAPSATPTGEQGVTPSTGPTDSTDSGTPTSTPPTSAPTTTDAPEQTTPTDTTDQEQQPDQEVAPDSGGNNAE
jgi:hypothetical protein